MKEKTVNNTDRESCKENVSDVEFYGEDDQSRR